MTQLACHLAIRPDCDAAMLAGSSPALRALRRALPTIARTDANLVIRAEVGSGKPVWAKAIHRESTRRDQRFLVLRPSGAVAGAAELPLDGGMLRAAAACPGATLYVETPEALPVDVQHRLADALAREDLANLRLIVGARSSLAELLRIGRLSPALYHRVAMVEITVPPLRERRQDVADIVAHCTRHWGEDDGGPAAVFTDAALAELQRHPWPGNVRELLDLLEAVREQARGWRVTATAVRALLRRRPQANGTDDILPLRQLERDYIRAAVNRCGGNQTLAARRLRIGRTTLIRKLREGDRPADDADDATFAPPAAGREATSAIAARHP